MDNQPHSFPAAQPNGQPLKPLTELLLDRRATSEFEDDEVPLEFLGAILRFAAQAPSGYNLQPWRFIVVRDAENRQRLQRAAFHQAKIGQAPVVVIAVGMTAQWKKTAAEVFTEAVQRGVGTLEKVDQYQQGALDFLSTMPMPLWVNRHTMIALTTMMLMAEAYGFDTAPMEGFDAEAVKREFAIPEEGEVVALLAIGRAKPPDKPYTGRLDLDRIVFEERFGQPWKHEAAR